MNKYVFWLPGSKTFFRLLYMPSLYLRWRLITLLKVQVHVFMFSIVKGRNLDTGNVHQIKPDFYILTLS